MPMVSELDMGMGNIQAPILGDPVRTVWLILTSKVVEATESADHPNDGESKWSVRGKKRNWLLQV